MNIRKMALSTFIAMLTAFQSLSVCTGNAEVIPVMENTQKTASQGDILNDLSFMKDEEGEGYYIAIGMNTMEETVPSEYMDMKVTKLCLDHVYISSDFDGFWGTTPIVLNIPEGVEIADKHWKSAVTGIPCLKLVYESGETEELQADDYDEMLEYTRQEMQNAGYGNLGKEDSEDMMITFVIHNPQRRQMIYPISYIFEYDQDGVNGFSYKDKDGANCFGAEVGAYTYSINVPVVFKGEKIDRIDVADIINVDNGITPDPISVDVYVPDGIEVICSKWMDFETGVSRVYVHRGMDKRETYYAEISGTRYMKTVQCEESWWADAPKIAFDKIEYSFLIDGKMAKDTNTYVDGFILHVNDDIEVVQSHWKAKDNHILKIKLVYPDGRTETYSADDYADFTKEKGGFKQYNRLVANIPYDDLIDPASLNDDTIWLFSPPEDVSDVEKLGDADTLILSDTFSSGSNIKTEEFKFPDTINELIIKKLFSKELISESLFSLTVKWKLKEIRSLIPG